MDSRRTSTPERLAPVPRRGRLRRLGACYRRHAWSATAALVLLVLIAGFVALQAVMQGRIGEGVSVAGIALQGQSTAAARTTLERRAGGGRGLPLQGDARDRDAFADAPLHNGLKGDEAGDQNQQDERSGGGPGVAPVAGAEAPQATTARDRREPLRRGCP